MATTVSGNPPVELSRWRRLHAWWENRDADINIRKWWGIAALLLAVAALMREPVLGLVALGVAVFGLVLRLWWDHALDKLTYTRHFGTTRAFHGDQVSVELVAENAKPLPIARLDVREMVGPNVRIDGQHLEQSAETANLIFRTMFSLGMYERVSHRYVLDCYRRGWHRLGPVRLTANDPFGMTAREREIDDREGVLVYPRIVPITQLVVPARQPLGDFKPAAPLVEDPMRMSGVRPYVPGDSPKRIHWRATARTGDMQTRVFEPSATPVAAVFLDTITFSHLWEGQNSDLLELSVTVAASLAQQMLEGKHQVGMYANAPIPNRSRSVRIPPGRRPGQFTRILEELAMLIPAFGERIEKMISEELPRLPWGASIVIITSRVSAEMQRSLMRVARAGGAQRFVLIAIGEEPPHLMPEFRRRVAVYHMGMEETWDVIETIQLTRVS
ncbi:MAG TPA: DUF58 domain-containing protein [Thermomicrobiales bacterium]|nr:DUF58 domain-containing protein [Thermomicrobiales bacterium]